MITLDRDSRHTGCIAFDNKSYILANYDDTLIIKGATLSGRNLEPFNREFIRECVEDILASNPEGVRERYDHWHTLIETGLIPPDMIKTRVTLNMSLDEYTTKLNSGNGSRAACYELALESEQHLQKGDVLEYYITEPPMVEKEYKTRPNKWVRQKMASYEKARLIKNYNNDLDKEHYIDRLHTTTRKFLGVLGWDRFKDMFPNIKLLKAEIGKMVPILGFEAHLEKFPKFGWRQKDYDKLNETDQQKFREHFKDNEKYSTYI